MTIKDRDKLLYKVLREMRFEKDEDKRYKLQQIGEYLVGEYEDWDYKQTCQELINLGYLGD